MLHKFRKWNWRDLYRLPPALFLWILVLRNYSMRQRGLLPDEWYWADEKLLSWGYAVSSNAQVTGRPTKTLNGSDEL